MDSERRQSSYDTFNSELPVPKINSFEINNNDIDSIEGYGAALSLEHQMPIPAQKSFLGELHESIGKIKDELPVRPRLGDYLVHHPLYTEDLLSNFLHPMYAVRSVDDLSNINISLFEDYLKDIKTRCEKHRSPLLDELPELVNTCLHILNDYNQEIKNYEKFECQLLESLHLNGQDFEDIAVKRAIIALYNTEDAEQMGCWIDPIQMENYITPYGMWKHNGQFLQFENFNREWQKLHEIIKNEQPDSLEGWQWKIASDIERIVEENRLEDVEDTLDYTLDITELNSVYNIEALFARLDMYFDIEHCPQRFLNSIIDFIFIAQESEKMPEGSFGDPTDEIDRRIHEYRDPSLSSVLEFYIYEKITPHLNTVFESLKYEAIMKEWVESDPDYTHLYDSYFFEVEQLNETVTFNYLDYDSFTISQKGPTNDFKPITIRNFLEKCGVTGSELSDETIAEYRSMMDIRVLKSLTKTFGVNIRELTTKEQYYFLGYLKKVTSDEVSLMKQFTSFYGVNGMRTFLSLEREGENYGDKIVVFGTEHEHKAGEIFLSYSALLNETNTLEQYINTELDCQSVDCTNITLVARGRLLDDAHAYLKTALESNDVTNITALEEKIIEARKLSAAFQAAIAADDIGTVETFRSFKSEEVPGPSLSPEKVRVLSAIYRKNYQNYGYAPAAIDELVSELEHNLTAKTSRVYIREAANNVLAYSVVTDNPDTNSSYVSGLNANPDLKGTKQGLTTLGQIVADNKARAWTTTGEASPQNFVGYSSLDHGWVATAVKPDELGQEAYMLDIAVFPNHLFGSKQLTEHEIIARSDDAVTQPEMFINQDGLLFWYTNNPLSTPPLKDADRELAITRLVSIEKHQGIKGYMFVLETFAHHDLSGTAPKTTLAA